MRERERGIERDLEPLCNIVIFNRYSIVILYEIKNKGISQNLKKSKSFLLNVKPKVKESRRQCSPLRQNRRENGVQRSEKLDINIWILHCLCVFTPMSLL